MREKVISLSPTMNRRANFRHLLMDKVDDYKLSKENSLKAIEKLCLGDKSVRDTVIFDYLWLAKDVVCRFRAHWPETVRMTDDLASEAMEALIEFIDNTDCSASEFFNKCQQFIISRVTIYINDNRSICAASRTTNQRRAAAGRPLEYNFAEPFWDYRIGRDDPNLCYVDILDSIERLAETDKEHIHTLITVFLEQDHNIDEESLSEEEREAIVKLSEIGKNL